MIETEKTTFNQGADKIKTSKANIVVPFLLGALHLLPSCNDTGFTGDTGKKFKQESPARQNPIADKEFSVPCQNGQNSWLKKVNDVNDISVKLEGEFCGGALTSESTETTILFVIDSSGSMRENDPLISGSCGRLRAAQAILDQYKGGKVDKLSVGFHIFGDLSQTVTTPTTLNQASSLLQPSTLCRADLSGTNYESALTSAKDTLENRSGRKLVYFVTDGLPTVSGVSISDLRTPNLLPGASQQQINNSLGPVYRLGLEAANQLRKLEDMVLFSVFLQPNQFSSASQPAVEAPEDYLLKIVGDASRLRTASSAQELAEKIKELTSPASLKLKVATVKGKLEAEGFKSREIKINSVTQTANPSVWKFVSEPFILFGRPGTSILNTATIAVENEDGKTIETLAKIEFAKEP